MTRSDSILLNGIRVCEAYKGNPDLLRQGFNIPALILVYWEIVGETGTVWKQSNKRELWEKAKKLRPGASKAELIDTVTALFVYEKVMGENL